MTLLSRRKLIVSGFSAAGVAATNNTFASQYFSEISSVVIGSKEKNKLNNHSAPKASPINYVTISALVTPDIPDEIAKIKWQFSTDELFENIVNADEVNHQIDTALKLNITLNPIPNGSLLYYRFIYENCHLSTKNTENPLVQEVNYHVMPNQIIVKSLLSYRRKHSKTIDKTNIIAPTDKLLLNS